MKTYNAKQYSNNAPSWIISSELKQAKRQAKQQRDGRKGKRHLWQAE
jgi:hypothetical protein